MSQFNPLGSCKGAYMGLFLLGLTVIGWNAYMYIFMGPNWVSSDPFNRQIFEWNWLENCCSWWPMLHLLSFTLLSFLYQNCVTFFFVAGLAW